MKTLMHRFIGMYLNSLTRIFPKNGGKAGFRLLCKPRRSPLKKHHHAFLQTARQTDFDFNGIPVRLYEWGNGPKKVLFVHGWQSHSFRWRKYVESLLAKDYTLIAFDAPGHGSSGGDQFTVPMNAYLISLLTERYQGFDTVIAHSIGSISVFYALAHYDLQTVGKVIAMASPSRAAEFFAFYVDALKLREHTVRQIKNEFQFHVRHQLERISLPDYARKVTVPGLIIHDETDPETPYQNALELLENWKNATLITTQGLGHNLKSPALVKVVKDYITGAKTGNNHLRAFEKKSFVLEEKNEPVPDTR
jgi:pimeloyl-ACP methyl ester carboxylesterase